ncbi:MAG TPA: hypothetical protein VMN39_07750 [Longimicrobiaceae bacterium]|nr:hypothetical protein [Longimicrobiaceae bacterium]
MTISEISSRRRGGRSPDVRGLFGRAARVHPSDPPARWAELSPWLDMAADAGVPVTVCEAAVGRGLPSYEERRLWAAALPAPHRRGILVFTDAARLSFVWTWLEPGPARWRSRIEHRLPGREATLERGLRTLTNSRASAAGRATADVPTAPAEVLDALARRCPSLPLAARRNADAFRQHVEESSAVDPLRKLWRAATRLRILDPYFTHPAWLIQAAETLAAIHLLLIERMRVWIDEAPDDARRRPEFLRDFRHVVEVAENHLWSFDRSSYARRAVLQQNIFAAAPAGQPLERCRAALLEFAGLSGSPTPILDCNACALQQMSGDGGKGRGDADFRAVPRPSLAVEIAVLSRGWMAARMARLVGYGTPTELSRAARQVEIRRRRLLRDGELPRGANAAGAALSAWPVVYAGVCGAEDFDVVRTR